MTHDEFLTFARPFSEPILLLERDGRILAANPAAVATLGLPGQRPEGVRVADLSPGSDERLARYLAQCARTREMVLGRITLRTASGETADFRSEGATVRPGTAERPAALLLRLSRGEATTGRFLLLNEQIEQLNRQIRERKRSEEQVSIERERLRVTLESIGDAVIATDASGALSFINPVAQSLTGWGGEEAIGRALADVFRIVNEYSRQSVEDPVAKVIREGAIVGLANHTILIARDGVERPVEDSGAPIRDGEGRIIGAVLVFRDVTEQRRIAREREEMLAREQQARRAAEVANRLKDEFLATVSHELRTPLNSMLGWARMLEAGTLDDEATRRAVEVIARNARAQTQIVNDLLDVSRIVAGKVRLEMRELDVVPVVGAATASVLPAAEARGVRVDALLDAGDLRVSGDASRLQQVVWNLLSNAVKFTPRGGTVTVSLSPEGERLRLEVRDTGIGIEREFLPHVFERFRQADGSTTREHGGLGLGLAIARQLVEMHGGTIEATSEGAGRGAAFVVELPAAGTARVEGAVSVEARSLTVAPASSEPSVDPPSLDGVAVLVVDDEPDARDVLATSLRLYGADVSTAGSVAEALSMVRERRPSVVVSDIAMPGADGYELVRHLRSLPAEEGGRVPAVALTAYARPEDRMRALAAGFHLHLPKPVDPTELAVAVSRLVRLAWGTD